MILGIPIGVFVAGIGALAIIVVLILEQRKRGLKVSEDATKFTNETPSVLIKYGGQGGIPYSMRPPFTLTKKGIHNKVFNIEGVNELTNEVMVLRGVNMKNFRFNQEDERGLVGFIVWLCNVDFTGHKYDWAADEVLKERLRLTPEEKELMKEKMKEELRRDKEYFDKQKGLDAFGDLYTGIEREKRLEP